MASVDDDDETDSSSSRSDRRHQRIDRLRQAAIEAEFETGRREDTVEEARDAVYVRLARMAFGWTLLFLGVVLLVLPGPGWLMIGLGLAVLSRDYAWAERTLERIKHRLPQDEDGELHPRVIVVSVVLFALATAGALWWYVIR